MKKLILSALLALSINCCLDAAPITISARLNWQDAPQPLPPAQEYFRFEGAVFGDAFPALPFFLRRFRIAGPGKLQVSLLQAEYEAFQWEKAPDYGYLKDQPQFKTSIARQREGYFGKVAFVPIVQRNGQYFRMTSFQLQIKRIASSHPAGQRGPTNTVVSALSEGEIYKLAITSSGLHKITYRFLKEELGIAVDELDPSRIQLLGNSAGPLPYYTAAERQDDLAELPISIRGGEDGSLDPGDFLLFYAEGPEAWSYDAAQDRFRRPKNIYDTRNYCFLKIGSKAGQRIGLRSSLPQSTYTSRSFDDRRRLEQEQRNLLHDWNQAQGSGKNWYGDHFKVVRSYTYEDIFDFPHFLPEELVRVQARLALRAGSSSRFYLDIAGRNLQSEEANAVNAFGQPNANINAYAREAFLEQSLYLNEVQEGRTAFTLRYPHPQGPGDGSEGWVDWVQFTVRRALIMSGDQMAFRDRRSLAHPTTTYQLRQAAQSIEIWDVTQAAQAVRQETVRSGSELSFSAPSEVLREFVAFDPQAELLVPEAVGLVPNQNLHAIQEADLLIVYAAPFEEEAQRLAAYRSEHSSMLVELAEVEQVFNEFASGRREPTAIRDFCRMLYDRSERFRYLLLFGDGSFDTRDLYGIGGDFIPIYQRENFNPVEAHPSDDFYGILYGNSPANPLSGELNIAVGRLPVNNLQQAREAVDKIIHYERSPNTLGDWRNRLLFVGDDKDTGGDSDHYRQADEVASAVQNRYPFFNIDKVYLDAFPQESTPGGERSPAATAAINRSIEKGVLTVTFVGHGGPKGWAQERILNLSDIFSWQNNNKLPVFITATCTFAGFDDPGFVSAGEEVLLQAESGGIGLMTTTRPVYVSGNKALNRQVFRHIFERDAQGQPLRLGEAMRRSKNELASVHVRNGRKFTLLGDPTLPLALPRQRVATAAINGKPVDSTSTDTLRALQEVTIEGMITDEEGKRLEHFDGVVYPTVYDKAQEVATLGVPPTPTFNYQLQTNLLFKGRASVQNGRFSFTFVLPKDINYELGQGKINYYAADETQMADAAGSYEGIDIGGTSPNAVQDEQGPRVEVFMNSSSFVFGSTVSPSPQLLVRLSDENGINVVGNSIGHDLEGILNEDTQNTYLLNDFYEAALDDHTSGEVRYPLRDLPEGRHRIRVKAWDVANNSSEGYTEFLVAPSGAVALERVLNYPNPFTDRTCFQFDHNLAHQEIEVLVQIYTVSGRLVKSLRQQLYSDGALRRGDCLEWDGRDDFGDPLAKGVYLYKVKIRTPDGASQGASGFEKLVILK